MTEAEKLALEEANKAGETLPTMEEAPLPADNTTANTDAISDTNLGILVGIKDFFQLQDVNQVLNYLITIADVLANNDDLAKVVLVEAKNQDGTLTGEELANFLADINAVNNSSDGEAEGTATDEMVNDKVETGNEVLDELVEATGKSPEEIDMIAKQLRESGNEGALATPEAFLKAIGEGNADIYNRQNAQNTLLNEHLTEGAIANGNTEATPALPVGGSPDFTIIQLSDKSKATNKGNKPARGSKWLESVIAGIK